MFLGVDGGGTKTAYTLIDSTGTPVASWRGPGIYYLISGLPTLEPLLAEGVTAVCAAAGITPQDIAYSFVGIPCYGEVSADVAALDALPRRVLGTDRYRCGNDMICGWAGSLAGTDGINVVAGTGSIAYGERAGRGLRAGGWGELFGDEGSGYWIATRALNAFSRMSDGRLPRGPLAGVLRRTLELTDDLDAVGVVLNRWKGDRARIAALSTAVSEAAATGDETATTILTDAGRELAGLVTALTTELGFSPGPPVPVSYSGGVFGAAPVLASFRGTLGPGFEVREPLLPPDLGAALYAARLAGVTITA